MLSLLHHPNLIKLLSYCTAYNQRILCVHLQATPMLRNKKRFVRLADPL
jgi:hypothetical protein